MTPEKERTPTQIFADVAAHQYANPTHGTNCACMDQYIRELRNVLNANPVNLAEAEKRHDNNLNKYFKSDEYKIVERWSYVLGTIVRNM